MDVLGHVGRLVRLNTDYGKMTEGTNYRRRPSMRKALQRMRAACRLRLYLAHLCAARRRFRIVCLAGRRGSTLQYETGLRLDEEILERGARWRARRDNAFDAFYGGWKLSESLYPDTAAIRSLFFRMNRCELHGHLFQTFLPASTPLVSRQGHPRRQRLRLHRLPRPNSPGIVPGSRPH